MRKSNNFQALLRSQLVSMTPMEVSSGRAIPASLEKDAQARGYLADCSQNRSCQTCARP
jgi:hypothetical protein